MEALFQKDHSRTRCTGNVCVYGKSPAGNVLSGNRPVRETDCPGNVRIPSSRSFRLSKTVSLLSSSRCLNIVWCGPHWVGLHVCILFTRLYVNVDFIQPFRCQKKNNNKRLYVCGPVISAEC